MKFGPFKESNIILGAGDIPNTESMPACICHDPFTGRDFTVGRLQFNDEEIEKIKKDGYCFVSVMGGWPPMIVSPDNPFNSYTKEQNFVPYDTIK